MKKFGKGLTAVKKDLSGVRMIFFDIDGTLIDMKKKCISEKTLEALRRLRERGILICLATGRGPMTLPRFDGVTFDAFLTFNGSYCFNAQETIFSNPIPADDVQRIIANAAALGRPVSVATKDRLAANGRDDDLVEYYAFAKLTVDVAEDFEQVAREDIYQVMLGCREDEYAALLHGVSGARITAWWDRAVDVIPAGSGKGNAIRRMLEYYHLDPAQTLAFGDGSNDIEMLETVGWGVAMGNASPRVKDAADDVCGHVAEDGVYWYCREQGLI